MTLAKDQVSKQERRIFKFAFPTSIANPFALRNDIQYIYLPIKLYFMVTTHFPYTVGLL
jgi:hypothetical protein